MEEKEEEKEGKIGARRGKKGEEEEKENNTVNSACNDLGGMEAREGSRERVSTQAYLLTWSYFISLLNIFS